MNRYLSRGIALTVIGVIIGVFGRYLQDEELGLYKWTLIVAVIVFGIGFLTIVYSLIRKIERKSILEDRAESKEDADETT